MSTTQDALHTSESYHLVKRMINQLSWPERERLRKEIGLNSISMTTTTTVHSNRHSDGPHPRLTDRESQVLKLIATGYTRKEVGGALQISHNTASSHVSHIYEKLQISTIAEATHAAIRLGLL